MLLKINEETIKVYWKHVNHARKRDLTEDNKEIFSGKSDKFIIRKGYSECHFVNYPSKEEVGFGESILHNQDQLCKKTGRRITFKRALNFYIHHLNPNVVNMDQDSLRVLREDIWTQYKNQIPKDFE